LITEVSATGGADRVVRVILPETVAESVGAVLMDLLGPFEQKMVAGGTAGTGPNDPGAGGPAEPGRMVALIFYPGVGVRPTLEGILASLPPGLRGSPQVRDVRVETGYVPRDWVDGWRDHFQPVLIGAVRIRPPWEPPLPAPVDVVIDPGMGFGTGLHPTTRGALRLLQDGAGGAQASVWSRGPLIDAGTGSGVLAIAAAKLGWAPVLAFDNDPEALRSARANVEANEVEGSVEVYERDVADAPLVWFERATVLANMTLEPVIALVRRLAAQPLAGRLVAAGILAGTQERELVRTARDCGFASRLRVREGEWASVELVPTSRSGE
jgi:ribosomal protein L11 methyltransferase